MTLQSPPNDILALMLFMSKITTYTIYYAVTFTISFLPIYMLCGGLIGCIGGLECLSSRTISLIGFGVPISTYFLTVLGLVVAQLTGHIAADMSWHALLTYTVVGMWSVALGLYVSWDVLDRVGKVVWKVLDVFGWVLPEFQVPEEGKEEVSEGAREEQQERKASGGDWVDCEEGAASASKGVKDE
ncbi:hypothetical protein M409DRAFT_59792 [Zasmidium cellare ATCC 36951]|uniref:Uncharacterized protein n=1 Tax=Zasmidium cellare ATCC 36951 TaxID=1080233 RepID=A0A6A6C3L4_ZASCE|nr:uncharacterized protein M409DRAFT_59792 [Zasmidium cellare ATCC 36951]KAF2160770.1 hypothetical protein M409DRAFT_59792 [Zasmidium cellare ATCC 36951]